MFLTTQKQSATDLPLSAEEFRALGNSVERVEDYEPVVESWRDNPACWLILPNGEISPPNGGQSLPENVTARPMARRIVPAPDGFIGAPTDPNIGKKSEPSFSRYLYHVDKSSRKIRVAKRDNGQAIKIRETESEILRRRAELEIVLPFFANAKEHRQAKRAGAEHDPRLAALCERLPPSPIVSREVREDDKIDKNKEQPEVAGIALQFLRLLQAKLGKRNGYLVFDCLRCGGSIRQSANGICAESSLRRWIAMSAK